MPSRRQRNRDGEDDIHKVVSGLNDKERKALKDELAKWPDPPGEEEFKGPYDGPDGEDLRK